MKWEGHKNSLFVQEAKRNGRDFIAGISGHAECMYNCISIFKTYNVKITTLLNCIWLVSCEHHSLHEVLSTDAFYGIDYEITKDPVDFLFDLLNSL